MTACKVSVIIPVHNAEQFLSQCIDSVLQQNFSDLEVILIDDASSDNSSAVLSEYQARDERIHVLTMPTNVGVSASRNKGIKAALGEFVIFVDADDYWADAQMLQRLYDAAVREQVDLVSFGFCRVDDEGSKSQFNTEPAGIYDLRKQQGWRVRYNIWAKLISRQLLLDNQIRYVSTWGEDALFSISLYCHASRLLELDEVYYCYRSNALGESQLPWGSEKLFGTVRWFEMAIPLIRDSKLDVNRVDTLHSVATERMKMLFNRLGTMAFEILSAPEQQRFFSIWQQCFEQVGQSYFDELFQADHAIDEQSIDMYREMLEYIRQCDVPGLEMFFKSDRYQQKAAAASKTVILKQQQAQKLGQDLLKVNRDHIRCDFGSGIIVTLSLEEAHQLARQLIANRNPQLTLKFN